MGARWVWIALGVLGAMAGACSLVTDVPEPGDTEQGAGGSGGMLQTGACETAADCTAEGGPCVTATCIANACGTVAIPAGFELGAEQQIPGDCLALACDGAGDTVSRVDDGDVPPVGACATYQCIEGTLLVDAFDTGTACSEDGGTVCDGAGECVECNVPSDCTHLPQSSECGERLCDAGQCVMNAVAAGTPLSNQSATPCVLDVCDGAGGITAQNDDLDLPNDNNPCTVDTCVGGVATFVPDTTASCLGGDGVCNNLGQCVGCVTSADCGSDTLCTNWQCDGGGVCNPNYVAAGTLVGPQDPDDCTQTVCDAVGNEIDVPALGETPPSDGNPCTLEVCFNGVPIHPPAQLDTPCNGGMVCDGLGNCVQCNSIGQCPSPLNQCQVAQCQSHTCGTGFVPDGTPTPVQMPGDCQTQICDGNGGTSTMAQPSDLPNDNNECTGDACNGSTPVFPPAAPGVPCNMSTMVCDGSGQCVDCLSDNHCASNEHCANAVCTPDRVDGQPCTRGTMCTSGFCIDGFCCNVKCGGVCLSCKGALTGQPNGVCAPITGGTDPENDCAGSQICYAGNCCDNPSETETGVQGLTKPQAFEQICPKTPM